MGIPRRLYKLRCPAGRRAAGVLPPFIVFGDGDIEMAVKVRESRNTGTPARSACAPFAMNHSFLAKSDGLGGGQGAAGQRGSSRNVVGRTSARTIACA